MKKRFLTIFLVLAMILSIVPLSAMAEGESSPATITMANKAVSAKLYAEADTNKATDLLSGINATSNAYTVDLEDGKYTLVECDAQDKSLGSIVLDVKSGNREFSVYVVTVNCLNEGWVCGVDYTVAFSVLKGGDQATIVRQVTNGEAGNTTLCLAGDDCTGTAVIPTAVRKAEGFAKAKPDTQFVVTADGYSTRDLTCGKAANFDVTYPYADANEDGKNDYVLEVGQMTNYYIYSYEQADSVSEPADNQVIASFSGLSAAAYYYRVTNPINSDAVTYGNYATLKTGLNSATVTTENMNIGNARNKNTVVRDFSENPNDTGDIYLSFGDEFNGYEGPKGQVSLSTGSSCTLYPFRNWLAVESINNAKVIEPDFHVDVLNIDGNPISVSEQTEDTSSKHSYTIQANAAGTAILLVTYDAMNYPGAMGNKEHFSAIWPENTGVVVVTVDQQGGIETNMHINDSLNEKLVDSKTGTNLKLAGVDIDAELDVLYYEGETGASYSFKPEDDTNVTMAVCSYTDGKMTFGEFSNTGVSQAADGTVTLSGLKTGKTIVKLTKDDKVSYQVLRAQQTEVTVTNKSSGKVYYNTTTGIDESTVFTPGDAVSVSYSVLKHPANKLSGIYNMSAVLAIQPEEGSVAKGTGNQYAFDSTKTAHEASFTIPSSFAGETFSFSATINVTGFGSYYGMHRILTYEKGKTANFTAVSQNAYFASLPKLELPIAGQGTANIIVKKGESTLTNYDLTIKDCKGVEVSVTDGTFLAYKGATYTYYATAEGCAGVIGSFTMPATGNDNNLNIQLSAPTGNAWDGTTKEPSKEGDVYQIGTGAELAWFAEKVNDGTIGSGSAKLTADIDLSNLNWNPIGNSSNQFSGIFDGNGHVLTGLYIDSTGTYQGLFGYLGSNGTIKNLGIEGQVTGGNYSAGVVAYMAANTEVNSCYANVNVTGKKWSGGIAGCQVANTAIIKDCYNRGNINGDNNQFVGGISGGSTNTSFATSINNCYNTGSVYSEQTFGGAISGTGNVTKVTNCYYLDGSWQGTKTSNVNKSGTTKTVEELKALSATLGTKWALDHENQNGGYPILSWQHDALTGDWTLEGDHYVKHCTVEGCNLCENSVVVSSGYSVQSAGNYVLKPQSGSNVDSSLAERYGYTDEVNATENVSALDVLIQAHIDKYGAAFTPETANNYFTYSYNYVTKAFEISSYSWMFTVNDLMPVDPNSTYNENYGYTGYALNQTTVNADDKIAFYLLQSTSYDDAYTWLTVETEDVHAGQDFDVTVKGINMMAEGSKVTNLEDLMEKASVVNNAKLAWVNMSDGTISTIDNTVLDATGKASVIAPGAPGTYYLTAISNTEGNTPVYVVMNPATVEVNAVDLVLSSDKDIVEAGKEFTVTISYPNKINGFQLYLDYDKEKIECVNHEFGLNIVDANDGNAQFNVADKNDTTATVCMAVQSNTAQIAEDNALVTLSFKAKENMIGTSHMDLVDQDINLTNVLFRNNSGDQAIIINANKNNQISNGITSYIKGDVNMDGKVNIIDANRIQLNVIGRIQLNSAQEAAGKVLGESTLSIKDAVRIQKYLVKLIPSL